MSNSEKIKELIAELKACPEADIHRYFAPTLELLPLLPVDETISIPTDFYNWVKKNEVEQPYKLPYAQFILGFAGLFTEKYEQSLVLLSDARLQFEEANKRDYIAFCDTASGGIYRTLGNVDLALKALWEAYAQLEKSGNFGYYLLANSFQIASIYFEQGNYSEAESLFEKTLASAEKLNNNIFISNSLQGLGRLYTLLNKYQEAKQALERALLIAEKTGSPMFISKPVTDLAIYYFETGDYAESLKLHTKALNMREQNNLLGGAITNLMAIADIDLKLNKHEDAIATLQKGLILAEKLKVKPKSYQLHQKLSNIYETKKEFEKSLNHFTLFHQIREEVETEDSTKKVKNLQLIFEAEQTRKENIIIKKQKEEIELKNTELEDKNKIIEEKNKDILDSITYAKRLQDAILPPLSIIKQHFPQSFVLYKPKDIVAGDFYWLEEAGGDTILIAAADCTGHGVPGALVSVVCSNALNRTVKEFKITEPGKILDKVRELVLETFAKSEDNVQDGMDISLASLSRSKGGIEVQWAGAYNSLWYTLDGEIYEIEADKQPIGKTDNPKAFTTHTIKISPSGNRGAVLYLFTDGYADQFGGEKGKKFRYKQLQELLLAISHKPMEEQKQILLATLQEWQGNLEQVDDILIIGIRV